MSVKQVRAQYTQESCWRRSGRYGPVNPAAVVTKVSPEQMEQVRLRMERDIANKAAAYFAQDTLRVLSASPHLREVGVPLLRVPRQGSSPAGNHRGWRACGRARSSHIDQSLRGPPAVLLAEGHQRLLSRLQTTGLESSSKKPARGGL